MEKEDSLAPGDLEEIVRKTFLRDAISFPETDSTNTQAKRILSTQPTPQIPLLLFAERQTSGRGRGSNVWWSATGSLTFSYLFDSSSLGLAQSLHPQLSLMTGLAILNACQSFLPRADFSLKWPNDVYLDGRKLAGILVETDPQHPQALIVGIGLNVNNSFASAPDELKTRGVSLSDVSGTSHPRADVLLEITQELESTCERLSRGDASLFDQWREACLLTGKNVSIQLGNETISGACEGIRDDGALRVMTGSGERPIIAGTVIEWSGYFSG